jgi:catechol 2,3-dioxygenase-like lactoylglutathione lyase family enzyme
MVVKDIDKSIDWYLKMLGFEVINQFQNASVGFRQANLKRGSVAIELFEMETVLST